MTDTTKKTGLTGIDHDNYKEFKKRKTEQLLSKKKCFSASCDMDPRYFCKSTDCGTVLCWNHENKCCECQSSLCSFHTNNFCHFCNASSSSKNDEKSQFLKGISCDQCFENRMYTISCSKEKNAKICKDCLEKFLIENKGKECYPYCHLHKVDENEGSKKSPIMIEDSEFREGEEKEDKTEIFTKKRKAETPSSDSKDDKKKIIITKDEKEDLEKQIKGYEKDLCQTMTCSHGTCKRNASFFCKNKGCCGALCEKHSYECESCGKLFCNLCSFQDCKIDDKDHECGLKCRDCIEECNFIDPCPSCNYADGGTLCLEGFIGRLRKMTKCEKCNSPLCQDCYEEFEDDEGCNCKEF